MPHKLVFGQKIKSPTIVRQAASWARRQARILFTAWQVQWVGKTESRVKNESFSTKCSRKRHIVAQNFIMTFQLKSCLDLGSKISFYPYFSPIGELISNTLVSGIIIALCLLIFWLFCRGYGLIQDSIKHILVV